jgi:hypothetical protein
VTDAFSPLPSSGRGVGAGLWARRVLVGLFTLVALLGLLGLFGQVPSKSSASATAATMTLSAPKTVRGGLFFQARLDITAHQAIAHPRLLLDEGWVEQMQLNSLEPQPVSEAPRDGRLVLSYDAFKPGDLVRIWVQFEVNPTNVARRSYDVELDDATSPLVRISRHITVLP